MQDLINFWEKFYFIEPVLGIVLCIALTISIKNRKKFNHLQYISLYVISLLLVCIFNALYVISYTNRYHADLFSVFADYSDYFFTLVELIIFSHFYYNLIHSTIFKKIILLLNLMFLPFFVYMLAEDKEFYAAISEKTQNIVYTVEGVVLLPICLSYFMELFRRPASLNLKNDPSFWISTGLLFFLACTLPFSVLENHVRKNYSQLMYWMYPIFYIFYILLFLMIIRAYLCKPEKIVVISLSPKSSKGLKSD